MMRQSVRLFALALFVLGSLSITPDAQALPRDWWITAYYDCNMNLVGERWRDCSGALGGWGAAAGAYKEHYQEECSTGNPVDYSWWFWNGSSWEPYTNQTC